MTTQLSFSVSEHIDDDTDDTDRTIQYGTFSRVWAEEGELDELRLAAFPSKPLKLFLPLAAVAGIAPLR